MEDDRKRKKRLKREKKKALSKMLSTQDKFSVIDLRKGKIGLLVCFGVVAIAVVIVVVNSN